MSQKLVIHPQRDGQLTKVRHLVIFNSTFFSTCIHSNNGDLTTSISNAWKDLHQDKSSCGTTLAFIRLKIKLRTLARTHIHNQIHGESFFSSKEEEMQVVTVLLWTSPVQALPCSWLPQAFLSP